MLPGYEGLLSLSLSVVPVLFVVVIILEAAMFPWSVSLLGPVAVTGVVVPGVVAVTGVAVTWVVVPGVAGGAVADAGGDGAGLSLSGPGPAAASYADPSDVSRLSEPTLPLLALPFPVPRLREFGPEAVRGQAPFVASAAVTAAGASPRSPGPRAARPPAAVRVRLVRMRHSDRPRLQQSKEDLFLF